MVKISKKVKSRNPTLKVPKEVKPKEVKPRNPTLKVPQVTDRATHTRLAVIRTQNVERHAAFESKQHLRRNILRNQVNQTHHMEMNRLKAATVRGGLHAAAEARIQHLENILIR
jgi:hypothetical protein